MTLITLPAGLVIEEARHWSLSTEAATPGRAMDGRQQFLTRENRYWTCTYAVLGAWQDMAGRLLAFADDAMGVRNTFAVPVCNIWTPGGAGQAAFTAALNLTPTQIANGIAHGDGARFSDGAGYRSPVFADPTVTLAAPAGATVIRLDGALAETLTAGAYLSRNGYLYRVASKTGAAVRINPPLREAIQVGDVVSVSAPTCIVRFASAEAAEAAITSAQWGGPMMLDVVEAFDR